MRTVTALALIVFSLLVSPAVAQLTGYGGAWIVTDQRAIGNSLDLMSYGSYPSDRNGAVLLSRTYYTVVDSLDSAYTGGVHHLDSLYTRGQGVYYSPDSLADTTALNLAQFLDQKVFVDFFFVSPYALDSVLFTVEQAYDYQPAASDSARAHSSTQVYHRGFFTTDTLFVDSLVAGLTCMNVAATSDWGNISRHYRDKFTIDAPMVRIKVDHCNILVARDTLKYKHNPVHMQLYVQTREGLLSGAGGRYNQLVPSR